jgi:hypothetical protein
MRRALFRFCVPAKLPFVAVAAASIVAVPSLVRAQADAGGALPSLPPAPSPEPSAPAAPPAVTVTATAAPPAEPAPPPEAMAAPCGLRRPYRHEGFYLAVDGGIGYGSFSGTGPGGTASIDGAAYLGGLAIGGTVAPGLVIGGAFGILGTSGDFSGGPSITATATYHVNGAAAPPQSKVLTNTTALNATIGAFVDWFPDPSDGWHVGGSIDLGQMSTTDALGTRDMAGDFGASIMGGYQWWLGPSWSMGIIARASIATKGSLEDSSKDQNGYSLMPFGVGVGYELLYY